MINQMSKGPKKSSQCVVSQAYDWNENNKILDNFSFVIETK